MVRIVLCQAPLYCCKPNALCSIEGLGIRLWSEVLCTEIDMSESAALGLGMRRGIRLGIEWCIRCIKYPLVKVITLKNNNSATPTAIQKFYRDVHIYIENALLQFTNPFSHPHFSGLIRRPLTPVRPNSFTNLPYQKKKLVSVPHPYLTLTTSLLDLLFTSPFSKLL